MPIPFILAGAALAAGGYGVKKGIDAKSDFSDAKMINNAAQRIYDEASKILEEKREQAQATMEQLGKTKFNVYQDSLIPFVDAFAKIKNINFNDSRLVDADKLPILTKAELNKMTRTTLEVQGVLAGGITALGGGGLAGLAAYGGVGLLGTASTGTAIGTLSGVAASNATLAWLGGGSLAAGGYGMAGGMMVLGGVVAGPVLAVGGMMLASKAEAAKEDAYANRNLAEQAGEEMKAAGVVTDGIRTRFAEIDSVIATLSQIFTPMLSSLEGLVANNDNYETYSEKNKKGVMMVASTALSLKNLIEAPILNEDGGLSVDSQDAIHAGKTAIKELSISFID